MEKKAYPETLYDCRYFTLPLVQLRNSSKRKINMRRRLNFNYRFNISAEEEANYEEWLDSQVEALTATNLDMGEILVNQQRGYQIAQSKDDFRRR